jgi:hypothetical protein
MLVLGYGKAGEIGGTIPPIYLPGIEANSFMTPSVETRLADTNLFHKYTNRAGFGRETTAVQVSGISRWLHAVSSPMVNIKSRDKGERWR